MPECLQPVIQRNIVLHSTPLAKDSGWGHMAFLEMQ
jgi:hypothetical protein